ncbi:MAG: hypothetical protein QM718_11165 [Steroidobacteraceae bacterium]
MRAARLHCFCSDERSVTHHVSTIFFVSRAQRDAHRRIAVPTKSSTAAMRSRSTATVQKRAPMRHIGATVALCVASSVTSLSATAAPPDITGMWTYRFKESREAVSEDGLTALARDFVAQHKRGESLGHVRNVANMKCLPAGFPALMMWRSPIQIMQGFGRIAINTEHDPGNDEPRTIYLDREQSKDPDPSWNGHSVGKWVGNTLVVDTVGLNGRGGFQVPLTSTTHVVERFHVENGGKLLVDEMTFEDPVVFTRPYKMTIRFDRMPNTAERMEAVCEPDLDALKETDLQAIKDFDSEAARMLDPDEQYNSAETESLHKKPLNQ